MGNVVQPGDATGDGNGHADPADRGALHFAAERAAGRTGGDEPGGGQALRVEAWSQDGSRELGTGRLTVINNTVDATSGTITLRAVFTNENRMLWPGEFVQARLIVQTVADGLTVPAPVVQRGPNGAYVWVVAKNVVEMRPVTVGRWWMGGL